MLETTQSFRYRAATADGRLVDGVVAAASERAAIASLEDRALVPVEVTPDAHARSRSRLRRTSQADALGSWTRTLGTMLGAGVPLDRALSFATATATHPGIVSASHGVRDAVQRGESLGAALRRAPAVFSPVVVAMISAGEEAGALDSAFARTAAYLEEQHAIRERLRAALSYPALLGLVASMAVLLMLGFVVPRFAAMLEELGGSLPTSTRLLLGASELAQRWWWLALITTAAGFAAARAWLSKPLHRERWDAARLHIPLAGSIENGLEAARFLRTWSLLLESGASVLAAVQGGRDAVVNRAMRRRLDQAIEDVRRGRGIAASLAGALPPLALELVAAGEESGTLAQLTEQAGVRAGEDAQRALRRAVSYVEPALILVFGLLVGFVALAMLQAIYSVNAATIIR